MAGAKSSFKHPATKFWGLAKLMLLLALILTLVATFLPAWSRIKGLGIAPSLAHLKYASTAITTESTLYVGLWQWCLYYGNNADGYTCGDTDSDLTPAWGNSKCKSYFLVTKVMTICTLGLLILAFVACLAVAKKLATWNPAMFFKAPKAPAAAALLLTLLALGTAIMAWVAWFIMAEEKCRTMAIDMWNPMQGYSSSFICMCIAAGLILLAFLLALLGFLKLNKGKQQVPVKSPEMMYPEVTEYPVVTDSPFMSGVTQGYTESYPVQQAYPTY